MIYYRTYLSKYGLAVAACDEELLGKKLKFKGTTFFVNPRFYKDKQGNEAELIKIMKDAINVNLVGKKAVSCGVKAGLVDEKKVLMIGNVPHAQALVMIL